MSQLSTALIAFALVPLLPIALAYPSQIPIKAQDHTQGYQFNPLLHLPGVSRYFDAVGFGLEHTPPEGCEVTAASYLIRHSAIYANDDEYEGYIKPFLYKLELHRGAWSGPLDFLNEWHSPIDEDRLEDITPHGLVDAENVGKHLVKRYPHLVRSTKKILSDEKSRCYDTATSLVKGFPESDAIEVKSFKKPKDGSMNPIIPHKSCKGFSKSPGEKEMWIFVETYANRTSDRLSPHSPWTLSGEDIMAMQSICGYESAITGETSKLCPVFTDSEWMSYEYAWDMRYAHMVGPLNPISNYLGFPWLQAQSKIFQNIDEPANVHASFDMHGNMYAAGNTTHIESDSSPGPYAPDQRFFLSFTHREVPPLIATALGIFNSTFEDEYMFPTDHVVWTRAWKMSDLIPFLGHVGLEKMTCNRPGLDGEFVRVIANTAPRPISQCQNGPGASCAMEDFVKLVGGGAEKFSAWQSKCGMKK